MDYYQRYIDEGYTEEQAFYLAEIKTTHRILVDMNDMDEYTPTLLLNSLLTLIVLPYEKGKRNSDNIFKLKIKDFERSMGISPSIFVPISHCTECNVKYNKRTTTAFINKMRNGIAHQNISVSICGDRDFTITIKNKYKNKNCNRCSNPTCKQKGLKRENGGVIDFEIKLSIEQLRRLAEYISSAYLKLIETAET